MLLAGAGALLLVCILVLGWAADRFAAELIPFETELKLMSGTPSPYQSDASGMDEDEKRIQQNLQQLADRLAAAMALPPGMSVQVSYNDADVVNAFAFLGGQITLFRGLTGRLHSENEIAMVLAHEIAHIKHRHVIRNLGRAVVIGTLLSMVMGSTESDAADILTGATFNLAAMSYSRDQEREADAEAVRALATVYGHVQGGAEVFRVLQEAAAGMPEPLPFMSTHPLSGERIDSITQTAKEQGWQTEGEQLPAARYQN